MWPAAAEAVPVAEYSLLEGGDDLLVGVNLVIVQDGGIQVLHLRPTQPSPTAQVLQGLS